MRGLFASLTSRLVLTGYTRPRPIIVTSSDA